MKEGACSVGYRLGQLYTSLIHPRGLRDVPVSLLDAEDDAKILWSSDPSVFFEHKVCEDGVAELHESLVVDDVRKSRLSRDAKLRTTGVLPIVDGTLPRVIGVVFVVALGLFAKFAARGAEDHLIRSTAKFRLGPDITFDEPCRQLVASFAQT